MAYWKYNGYSFPTLPEWAEEYAYVTIHDPNLGSSFLIATNEIRIQKSNNITYGDWYDTYAIGGVKSLLDSGSWGAPVTNSNEWILGNSPYMDGSYRAKWSNTDIYCAYDDGTEYLGLAGSAPADPETGEEILWPPVAAPAMDCAAFVQGWLVGRALALYRKAPEKLDISVLAATFDPLTAEMKLGQSGTLGGTEFVIGYSGMPIRYSDGHLTVEDTK